jgi:hypothetical protein
MAHTIDMGNDGIIRVRLTGDLERGYVENLRLDYSPFVSAATPQNPLKTILFMESLGKLSSAARKYLTELSADPRVGMIAFIQPPRRAKVLGKFIHRATGKNKISFFENEAQALAWLKSENVFIPST